jgi:hypothetical protein
MDCFVVRRQRRADAATVTYNAGMLTLTRHWRMRARIAWIACLAILFSAFAPLVSHAMEAASPAPVIMAMEVCTAMGMETISMAGPERSASASGKLQKSMNHCGYCVAHAGAHGLPPPTNTAFAAPAGRDAWPPLYYHASRPLFPWSLAQPRAPPLSASLFV